MIVSWAYWTGNQSIWAKLLVNWNPPQFLKGHLLKQKGGPNQSLFFFSRQSFLETIGLFLLFFRRTTSRKWSEANKKSFGAVRKKSVQTYIWDSSYLLPYYLQFLPLFEMTKDLMLAKVWKIHNTGANSWIISSQLNEQL